ncbi:tRNA pseudouridine synthase A [Novymonas esmeraldas]|uniref:tRNA pseudouridine synthase A n=1 Tax=Novymonas esmeraldas TaxID=1808958 RepID=A0AAW0F2P8_9TRYP
MRATALVSSLSSRVGGGGAPWRWPRHPGHVSRRWCTTAGSQTFTPADASPSKPRHGAGSSSRAAAGAADTPRLEGAVSSSAKPRRRGNHRGSRRSPHRHPTPRPSSSSAPLPRSLDISDVEDMVDVERYFPTAVAHLKATPASPEAAEASRARRWHETTHELNADGIVTPAKRAAMERRDSGVGSFFDEGGLDVRGGMADKLRSGAFGSARDTVERDSPDILKLTGGNVRRHGGLRLAAESNAAAADQTIEGDHGDAGAYHEFGDTPVQLTDMLRERLMELKAETLREERNETFLPQRLQHRSAHELLLLAQQAEAERRAAPPSSSTRKLTALAATDASSRRRAAVATLADLAPGEEEEEGEEAETEGAAGGKSRETRDPAILRDGVAPARVAKAMELVRHSDGAVPGRGPDDPLQRLAAMAAHAGRRAAVASEEGRSTASAAEGVERPGLVHLLRTLPRAGFCSRREAAVAIASGQVRVNNVVERNPFRLVRAEDDVHVAGHKSRLRFAPPRLWMYHKPANVIVSRHDVAGRTLVTKHARILGMDHLVPVGSLPMRAHGILLLTNDGELSRFLENPQSMVQRTYLLRVRPAFDPVLVHKLNTEGIHINGRCHRGVEFFVNPATKSRYSVKVKVRGESMPIAHLMQHLGRTVERGGRISFGPFALTNLAVGSVREVTVPPFYSQHLGAAWKPFVERDWPYFRRQRVSRLRRLCRHRELTPRELEELDNYTYEEVRDALSFESSELQALAEHRARQQGRMRDVDDALLPLPTTFPTRRRRGAADDVAVDDDDDAAALAFHVDDEDGGIVEDITAMP